jgi:hypothetical protein
VQPLQQAVVDDPLMPERAYLGLSLLPLQVDLVLLCPDKRPLVDIGMHLDVGVVA